MTAAKRKVEVFTAGCPLCDEAVALVKQIACPSCEVVVHDLRAGGEAEGRARSYGVNAVPAVVVDGRVADCCSRGAVDEQTLRAAGVGVA
ncbi:thioredoxin family protein [Nitrospinae bacterium AH_259_B05_G02_I21]|nr:thioredoxin family protein [Nitrospinae bacterium AH_259_B05_G02_I21]MDA2932527.1 thioredoxin family protein [Nitrospinae bacterium AH-259-F20]